MLEADGRWNRPFVYGCLYTALSESGARAEYRKLLRRAAVNSSNPRDLVAFEVTVRPVLDLTDGAIRRSLGVTKAQITSDNEANIELCRRIADHALATDHQALLAPSAAEGREPVLAIYLTGELSRLRFGEKIRRVPLNY